MAIHTYKKDLKDLHILINVIVRELKTGNLKAYEKDSLVERLLEETKDLYNYNCRTFLTAHPNSLISHADAVHLTTTVALWKAIVTYDESRNVYFLKYWERVTMTTLLTELKHLLTGKNQLQDSAISLDKKAGDSVDDTDLYNLVGTDEIEDRICFELDFKKAVNHFIAITKNGELIKCELINNKTVQTKARLKMLGSTVYGDSERNKVKRIKKKFAEFILDNYAELGTYLIDNVGGCFSFK